MSGTQYKNTRGEVVMNIYAIIKRISVLGMLVFLTGCLDKINLTNYTIEYPINGATYIGYNEALPSANAIGTTPLNSKIKINFENPISSAPRIALNGRDIANVAGVVYSATGVEIPVVSVAQFLRQGRNTLSVEPNAFGPTVTFNYDGMGPIIVVTSGKVTGNNLELKGYLRDFSATDSVMNLELYNVTGYNPNGSLKRIAKGTLPVPILSDGSFNTTLNIAAGVSSGEPLLYRFTARDTYGYSTQVEYMADTDSSSPLVLQNAVRVAIGDTFVASMRPIIASSIKKSLDAAPIDARCVKTGGVSSTDWTPIKGSCVNWNDPRICGGKRGVISGKNITQDEFDKWVADGKTPNVINDSFFNCDGVTTGRYYSDAKWNADGGKLPNDLTNVAISLLGLNMTAVVQNFYMHNGAALTVGGENLANKKGTMLLNEFKVLSNNELQLNLAITEMVVQLLIEGSGIKIKGGGANGGMRLYIKKTFVNSGVSIEKTRDNDLKIQLIKSNISLDTVKMDNIQACVWILPCIGVTGLANVFMPMLTGLLGDLLPDILNPILEENLKKLVIGGLMTQPDNQTSFDAQLIISELGTEQKFGLYDLKTTLDSLVDVQVSDPNVKPILGPVFYDDPINPDDIFNANSGSAGGTAANLTVAVNSNLINSAFAAMHATGVTFFTSHGGKTYYGAHPNTPVADPSDVNAPTIANKGDTRIRLWPDTPPVLMFERVEGKPGESKAEVTYSSATLYYDKLVEVSGSLKWQTQVSLEVDFSIGVQIGEEDGNFTLGASEPPIFNINKQINNTQIQVPSALIQGILDVAMSFGGSVLADQFIVFDFNAMVANQFNGQTVKFLSSDDNFRFINGAGSGENDCIRYENGVAISQTPNYVAGTDGQYDVVCYTIDFDVATHKAGVTGAKGRNLFFQMKLADSALPPPPAMPELDLDGDGVIDYKDNCAVPQIDLQDAMTLAGYEGIADLVDDEGQPKSGVVNNLRSKLHDIYTTRHGALTADDRTWFNGLRNKGGDANISSTNWVDVLYSNAQQSGYLCQADDDRDGILDTVDNCPGVYNPDQKANGLVPGQTGYDSSLEGDACNVEETWVMIRSLGSRYQNKNNQEAPTNNFQCLTHEHYKVTNTTQSGVNISQTMRNNSPTLGLTTKDCNPADINQRWYLASHFARTTYDNSNSAPLGNTLGQRMYQIFADANRSNQNSWQLVAYTKGKDSDDGEIRMAKWNKAANKNDVTTLQINWDSNKSAVDNRWTLGLDPTAINSSSSEDQIHPWVLRPTNYGAYSYWSCLYFNNDGWGTDFGRNSQNPQCANTYTGGNTHGDLPDKFYRWGILIQGTQLWMPNEFCDGNAACNR